MNRGMLHDLIGPTTYAEDAQITESAQEKNQDPLAKHCVSNKMLPPIVQSRPKSNPKRIIFETFLLQLHTITDRDMRLKLIDSVT